MSDWFNEFLFFDAVLNSPAKMKSQLIRAI